MNGDTRRCCYIVTSCYAHVWAYIFNLGIHFYPLIKDFFIVVNFRATLEIGAHSIRVEFHVNVPMCIRF